MLTHIKMNNALKKGSERSRFLAIKAGDYGYGIPINNIQEIVIHSPISSLPNSPEFVRGMSLVRRESIPVIDLNLLLGNKFNTEIHEESCFIVLRLADRRGSETHICLLADEIIQTYSIDEPSIDKPPVVANEAVIQYIIGLGRINKDIFILLDPAKLLSPSLESLFAYSSQQTQSSNSARESNITPISASTKQDCPKKFLSIFNAGMEYAFPLHVIRQVIAFQKIEVYEGGDIPDNLFGAVVYENSPVGILCLSHLMASQPSGSEDEESINVKEMIDTKENKVIVFVELPQGFLGILVDRIGKSYENKTALSENSYCKDLERGGISSLGFIENKNEIIEVIDPTNILDETECKTLHLWSKSIKSMFDISDANTEKSNNGKDKINNPLAVFSGTYLVVRTGDNYVALKTEHVDEVLSYDSLLLLNDGPAWFKGLIDLRGSTYPVIDLELKLGVSDSQQTSSQRNILVMVQLNDCKMGLMINEVVGAKFIEADKLRGDELSELMVTPEVLNATADLDGKLVHLINLKELIDREDISVRDLMNEMNRKDVKESN